MSALADPRQARKSNSPHERLRDRVVCPLLLHRFQTPQEEVAAALLRRATHRITQPKCVLPDTAGYLDEEAAGRIIEIQGEGTTVGMATLTQSKRLTEFDGSQEVSVRLVVPHA